MLRGPAKSALIWDIRAESFKGGGMRWMLAIALVAALAGPLRAEEAGKRIEMTGGV